MAAIHRLTARAVSAAKVPGLYADGGGLYLQVTPSKDGIPNRSWLVRYTAPDGRRREMGIGSSALVDLGEARALAVEARKAAKRGDDPIDARRMQKNAGVVVTVKAMTFRDCAETYVDTHSASWKNAKHRCQWRSSLERLAFPALGDIDVAKIDADMVMRVLDPIWTSKTETATRLRGRIEAILDWAALRGYRQGENPARWRGHLQKALPNIKKSLRVRHHPALPYADISGFMRSLERQPGMAARALQFCILTATRTGETIYARWNEIDLNSQVWTIPAERMKAAREHRIPLTTQTLHVITRSDQSYNRDAYVFAGARMGRPLSNMALLMTLRRMGHEHLTTHGFRSTFRDWVAEQTNYPREVAEAALAHSVGNQVEAAYRRGDLFEKRRALMEDWGRQCLAQAPSPAGPA